VPSGLLPAKSSAMGAARPELGRFDWIRLPPRGGLGRTAGESGAGSAGPQERAGRARPDRRRERGGLGRTAIETTTATSDRRTSPTAAVMRRQRVGGTRPSGRRISLENGPRPPLRLPSQAWQRGKEMRCRLVACPKSSGSASGTSGNESGRGHARLRGARIRRRELATGY
jgi:hypothetical protein